MRFPFDFSSRHTSPLNPLSRLAQGLAAVGATTVLVLAAGAAPIASAQIASGSTGIDNSGNAQQEMAACNSGKSQEDRATCSREVRNAQAAKRAGKLGNEGGQYAANALKRCEVFKTNEDKIACEVRVTGQGTAQGSVAGGGVMRQVEVVTPGAATTAP